MSGTRAGALAGWETRRARLRGEAEHAAGVQRTVRGVTPTSLRGFRQQQQTHAKTARAGGRLGQEARALELANAAAARERVLLQERQRHIIAREQRIARLQFQLDAVRQQAKTLSRRKEHAGLRSQNKRAQDKLRAAIAGERAAIADLRRGSR